MQKINDAVMIDGVAAWTREEIRQRAEIRAAELGQSLPAVLREIGYANFFAPRLAGTSTQIDTLERIAAALDWSLCELLGCGMDRGLVEISFKLAMKGLNGDPDRDTMLWDTILDVYSVLIQYQADGIPLDDSHLSAIETMLRGRGRPRRNPLGSHRRRPAKGQSSSQ